MKPESGRNAAIEGMRFVSAFGIVWFHARAPGMNFGYAGLVFFLFISFYFAAGKAGESGTLKKRIAFLGIPFLWWSLFYGLLNLASRRPFFGSDDRSVVLLLLTGPSVHLWYLPFTALGTIVLYASARIRKPGSGSGWEIAFGTAALLSTGWSLLWRNFWPLELPVPLAQWLHAVPACAIGIFFRSIQDRSAPVKAAAALVFSSAFICAILIGDPGFGVPYLLGTNLALVGLHMRVRGLVVNKAFGGTSMEIYLIHILVFIAVAKSPRLAANPGLFAIASFLLSWAAALGLRRARIPAALGIV